MFFLADEVGVVINMDYSLEDLEKAVVKPSELEIPEEMIVFVGKRLVDVFSNYIVSEKDLLKLEEYGLGKKQIDLLVSCFETKYFCGRRILGPKRLIKKIENNEKEELYGRTNLLFLDCLISGTLTEEEIEKKIGEIIKYSKDELEKYMKKYKIPKNKEKPPENKNHNVLQQTLPVHTPVICSNSVAVTS